MRCSMKFSADLATGHKGELELLKLVPALKRTNGLQYDFETPSGLKVEVKYDTTKYTNLFLETISNESKGSAGGPLSACRNNVDYFVYMFSRGDCFVFKNADLVFFLYQNKERYPIKTVRNQYYNTLGHAVPIKDIKHLCVPIEELSK